MAQLCTRAPQVVGCNSPEAEFARVLLYDVPNQAFGHTLAPAFASTADATESLARLEFCGRDPIVDSRFYPGWHRYGPDVPALTDQINNRPMLLSLLQMREVQIGQFASPQPAAKQ